MTREELQNAILETLREEFEIANPELDDDLRKEYNFDSIDAVELLLSIEDLVGFSLTQEEKKRSLGIRTVRQICDYVESMMEAR